jgi:hypothetical protein
VPHPLGNRHEVNPRHDAHGDKKMAAGPGAHPVTRTSRVEVPLGDHNQLGIRFPLTLLLKGGKNIGGAHGGLGQAGRTSGTSRRTSVVGASRSAPHRPQDRWGKCSFGTNERNGSLRFCVYAHTGGRNRSQQRILRNRKTNIF